MQTRFCITVAFWALATILPHAALPAADEAPERPNIVWLTSEDNGIFWVSCYGGKNCRTPI